MPLGDLGGAFAKTYPQFNSRIKPYRRRKGSTKQKLLENGRKSVLTSQLGKKASDSQIRM